jgi:Raf kinase inhibitor-like YbhB/YbcL family protein
MRSFAFVAALLIAATGSAFAQAPAPIRAVGMTLSSPDFQDGGIIPDQYTGKVNTPGQPPKAISPALTWTGTPAGTQSFVLIMHDLDVMVGKSTADNLHWLAYNIPATATSLPQNVPTVATLPDGTVQLRRGNPPNYAYGYSGPGAPAPIYHHYVFEIWALDTKITLPESATRDDVLKTMDGHALDKGMLVGRFHR